MKIDSHELRKEINKLHSEIGWISKDDVKKVIDKLEQKSNRQQGPCWRLPPKFSREVENTKQIKENERYC